MTIIKGEIKSSKKKKTKKVRLNVKNFALKCSNWWVIFGGISHYHVSASLLLSRCAAAKMSRSWYNNLWAWNYADHRSFISIHNSYFNSFFLVI